MLVCPAPVGVLAGPLGVCELGGFFLSEVEACLYGRFGLFPEKLEEDTFIGPAGEVGGRMDRDFVQQTGVSGEECREGF